MLFLLYTFLSFVIIYLYTYFVNSYYSDYTIIQNSTTEHTIIMALYLILFFIIKQKRYFIPLIILSLYAMIDIVSLIYNRNLDFTYIFELPLLVDALVQSKGQIVYIVGAFVSVVILYSLYKYKLIQKIFLSYLAIAIFFTILTNTSLTSYYISFFEKFAFTKKEFWSNDKLYTDYKKTGRFSSFLYEGIIKTENKNNIKNFHINQKDELEKITNILKTHIEKRDVYIVGLESFFIPSRLKNLDLNHKVYDINNSSQHRGSIFGGGTIQSEFEVLCGVPALQLFSAFELTEFKGSPTNCLPSILKDLGYNTIFTNTYKPQPSQEAARGLGFDDINFPKEYLPKLNSYLTNKNISKGEYAIFDDDLYKQNNDYIANNYIEKKPILNYMFSVWGHAFHDMTSSQRPQIIDVKNKKELGISQHSIRAVNQQYYRINAIKKYLKNIRKISPNALVIMYSDHLPVLDNKNSYKTYGLSGGLFDNFLLIMDKGKVIKYNKVNLYAVQDIILDRLTSGWYCKHTECKLNEKYQDRLKHIDDYYKIMIPAMKDIDSSFLNSISANGKYFFNSQNLLFKGFSVSESNFRWTSKKLNTIEFRVKNKINNHNLLLNIATLGKQKIIIKLNDKQIFSDTINTTDTLLTFKVKLKELNKLTFITPDAKLPGNGDTRTLAMQFKYLELKTKP